MATKELAKPGEAARWQLERDDGSVFCDGIGRDAPAVKLDERYSVGLEGRHPWELDVGDATLVEYDLGERKANYRVRRVADEVIGVRPRPEFKPEKNWSAGIPVKPQLEVLPGLDVPPEDPDASPGTRQGAPMPIKKARARARAKP